MGFWPVISITSALTSQLAPTSTSPAPFSTVSTANMSLAWASNLSTIATASYPTVSTTVPVVDLISTTVYVEIQTTSVSTSYEPAPTAAWEPDTPTYSTSDLASTSGEIDIASTSTSSTSSSAPTAAASDAITFRVLTQRTTTITSTYTPTLSAPSTTTPAPTGSTADATAAATSTVVVNFDCDNGIQYGSPTAPVKPVATASGVAIAVAVSNDPHDYHIDVVSDVVRVCSVDAEGSDQACSDFNMKSGQNDTSVDLEARGMTSWKRVGRALARRECNDRNKELATALGTGLGLGLPGVAGAGWLVHKAIQAARLCTLSDTIQYKPLQVLEDGIPDLFKDLLPPATPPQSPPLSPLPPKGLSPIPEGVEPLGPLPAPADPPVPVKPEVEPPSIPKQPVDSLPGPVRPPTPNPPVPAGNQPVEPPIDHPVTPEQPGADPPTPVSPVTPQDPAPPAPVHPVKPHSESHNDKGDHVKDEVGKDDSPKDDTQQQQDHSQSTEHHQKDQSNVDDHDDNESNHDDHQEDNSRHDLDDTEPKDGPQSDDSNNDDQHEDDKDQDDHHDDHEQQQSEPKEDVKDSIIDQAIHRSLQRSPHDYEIRLQRSASAPAEVQVHVNPDEIAKTVEESLSSQHEYVEDRVLEKVVDAADSQLENGQSHLDKAALKEAAQQAVEDVVTEIRHAFEAGVNGAAQGGAGQDEAVRRGRESSDDIVAVQSAADFRAQQMRDALRDRSGPMNDVLELLRERGSDPRLPDNDLDDLDHFEHHLNQPGPSPSSTEVLEDYVRELRQEQSPDQSDGDREQAQRNWAAETENFLEDLTSQAEFRSRSRHGYDERAPSEAPEVQPSSSNGLERLADAPFVQHEARKGVSDTNSHLSSENQLTEHEGDALTELLSLDSMSDAIENTVGTGTVTNAQDLGMRVEAAIENRMSEDLDRGTFTYVDDMMREIQNMVRQGEQQLRLDYRAAVDAAADAWATSDELISVSRQVLQEEKYAHRQAVQDQRLARRLDRYHRYDIQDVLESVYDVTNVEPTQRAMDAVRADLESGQIARSELDDPSTYLRIKAQIREQIPEMARQAVGKFRQSVPYINEVMNHPGIELHGPSNALNAHNPGTTEGMSPIERKAYLKQTHPFWYEYPAEFDYVEAMHDLQNEINSRLSTTGLRVSDARLVSKLQGQLQQMDAYKTWCVETNMDSRAYPPTRQQMHEVAQKWFEKHGKSRFASAQDAERFLIQPWRSGGGPSSRPSKL